jgi:hypothetical protein
MNPKTVFSKEVRPLGQGVLLTAPLQDLPLSDQIPVFAALKRVVKLAEERLKSMKPGLMAVAAANGTKDESGHSTYEVDGCKITRQYRQDKIPDLEKLQALLGTKGIALEEAFVPVNVLELSPSKLDFLIQTGKLTKEEVDALKDESFACLLKESPELKALLDEVSSPPAEEEDVPRRTPKKKHIRR